MLSVLANRTYRRLFAAQIIALIGTGMMTVVLGLLAFNIAGDEAGAVLGTANGDQDNRLRRCDPSRPRLRQLSAAPAISGIHGPSACRRGDSRHSPQRNGCRRSDQMPEPRLN